MYCPGGLWREKGPPGVEFPYQSFVIIGETFSGQTSNTTHRLVFFEIHTFLKAQDDFDPQEQIDEIVDLTETAFDRSLLTVTDRTTYTITQTDRRTFEEDSQVYRGLNEFSLRVFKGRT